MANTLDDQVADAGDATAERLEALEQDLQKYRVSSRRVDVRDLRHRHPHGDRQHHRHRLGGRAMTTTGGSGAAAAAAPHASRPQRVRDHPVGAGTIDVGGSIEVTNAGSQAHNLGVEGTDLLTPDIEPGGTATLDLSSLDAGTYTLYCDIAGHADSGMTTPLVIGRSAEASAAAAAGHEDHAAMTPEQGAAMDQQMMESILAFPAESEGRGNQPLEPEVLDRRHEALRADCRRSSTGRSAPVRSSRRGPTTGWCPDRGSTSTSATRSRSRSPTSCRSAPTSTGTASTCPTTRTASPRSPRS